MSLFASWGQINSMIPSYSAPYFMPSFSPVFYPMQSSFFSPGFSAFSPMMSGPMMSGMMPGMGFGIGAGMGMSGMYGNYGMSGNFGMNSFMPQPYMQQPHMMGMGGSGFNSFNPMYDMQRQMANQQNFMIANGQSYDAQMRANMLSHGGFSGGFGMPQMGGFGTMSPGMF